MITLRLFRHVSLLLITAVLLLAHFSCSKGSSTPNIACTVSTFAGTGASGLVTGAGTSATFSEPRGMTIDENGNLYVCDSGTIRGIAPDATVSNAAYSEEFALADFSTAGLSYTVYSIASDDNGHLYAANPASNQVFYVAPFTGGSNNGIVYPFAGSPNGTAGVVDGDAIVNSLQITALLTSPFYITYDKSSGSFYFTDESAGLCIRKIAADGTVTHVVKVSDFPGSPQHLDFTGLVCDNAGNIYASDDYDYTIWKITPAGTASVFLKNANLNSSAGIAIDNSNNLYVACTYHVWEISPTEQLSLLAGGGAGAKNGPGADATFGQIGGIAVDGGNNIYVSDLGNKVIRKIVLQ